MARCPGHVGKGAIKTHFPWRKNHTAMCFKTHGCVLKCASCALKCVFDGFQHSKMCFKIFLQCSIVYVQDTFACPYSHCIILKCVGLSRQLNWKGENFLYFCWQFSKKLKLNWKQKTSCPLATLFLFFGPNWMKMFLSTNTHNFINIVMTLPYLEGVFGPWTRHYTHQEKKCKMISSSSPAT